MPLIRLNRIASRITDVPLRVFFDHQELPGGPEGFELFVVGSEEVALGCRESYRHRGARVVANPFLSDCREQWSGPVWPRRAP